MAITTMDIGQIGAEDAVFKRKFRWVLHLGANGTNEGGEMWYARVTSRPTLNVEPVEIYHLHETHKISGKPKWETINITIYDVKYDAEINTASASERELHRWLNRVWKFSRDNSFAPGYEFLDMGDHDLEYKLDLTIRMLDGHGNVMETWWLLGAWPNTANWGDLDYNSNDTADVELTVSFDRAQFFPGDQGLATGGAPPIG